MSRAMPMFDEVTAATAFLRQRFPNRPEVAVVLGSGLGAFAERLEAPAAVAYTQVPHWPAARVVGHSGRLLGGLVRGRRVLVLSGRSHVYEGHSGPVVTFGMRVVRELGARAVILTNAAGGINATFLPGTLMVIDDHINLMGVNPLAGPHDPRHGERFPDMSEVYSRRLRRIADEAARACGVGLAHGVYLAVSGPSYETPAEIRAFRTLGADAVGMSTVPEAIVARQTGLEVLGISCISNLAAGLSPQPPSADEVVDTARGVAETFGLLLEETIARL